jgi:hypothetical protein
MAVLETTLLLAAAAAYVWLALRPAPPQSGTLWAAGWGALLVAGRPVLGAPPAAVDALLGFFGALFPFFLLAGALRFAERRLPRWLLPAGVALGGLRIALRAAGANGPDLVLSTADAALVVAAAIVAARHTRADASIAQRLLGPAFLALAAMDVLSAAYGADLGVLLVPWVAAIAAASALMCLSLFFVIVFFGVLL